MMITAICIDYGKYSKLMFLHKLIHRIREILETKLKTNIL